MWKTISKLGVASISATLLLPRAATADVALTATPIELNAGGLTEILLSVVNLDVPDLWVGGIEFSFPSDPGLELVDFQWIQPFNNLGSGYLNSEDLPNPYTLSLNGPFGGVFISLRDTLPVAKLAVRSQASSGIYALNPGLHIELDWLVGELNVLAGDTILLVGGECALSDTNAPIMTLVSKHTGVDQPAFNGYIDPRIESNDGYSLDRGPRQVWLEFNEPVFDVDGDRRGLTPQAFEILQTDGVPPAVAFWMIANQREVMLEFSSPIALQEWTTIVVDVEDLCGNRIGSEGDLGPDIDELDRIDIGFLPGDIDQDGVVRPIDLLRMRQLLNGQWSPAAGAPEDYADSNRGGVVLPSDFLAYRQMLTGEGSATRAWAGSAMHNPRP